MLGSEVSIDLDGLDLGLSEPQQSVPLPSLTDLAAAGEIILEQLIPTLVETNLSIVEWSCWPTQHYTILDELSYL